MAVNAEHPDYEKYKKQWDQIQDCLAGSDAIKDKSTKYLPAPPGTNVSDDKYQNYIKRAVYTNYTKRTLDGLAGAVFRKNPEIELPDNINYLIGDSDGVNLSLSQLSRSIFKSVLSSGRHGILVDLPSDYVTETPQPHLINYPAQSIINWRVAQYEGINKLSLVVLVEDYAVIDADGFGESQKKQYRVLKLDEDGLYTQLVYRENDIVATYYPTDYEGNRLDTIPFIFIGSDDNSANVDTVPLYDISTINIAHYRNSADYETLIYLLASPTLFVTSDLDKDQFTAANGRSELQLGTGVGYFLGTQGTATLLELNESQAAQKAMDDKVTQMVALGAKIIQRAVHNMTAEEAKIRHSAEISILDKIVSNINAGITSAIGYVCSFTGADISAVNYKLNDEYYDKSIDPQTLMAQIQLVQMGIIGKSDIRDTLRKSNIIDHTRTDEQIDDDIDNGYGDMLGGA